MNTLKQSLLLCLSIGYLPLVMAEPIIPAQWVGIWATPGSQFEKDLLKQGEALYLNDDGHGVIMAAPPPIGMALYINHIDTNDNSMSGVLMTGDPEHPTHSISLHYDPQQQTLKSKTSSAHSLPLHRHATSIPKPVARTLLW